MADRHTPSRPILLLSLSLGHRGLLLGVDSQNRVVYLPRLPDHCPSTLASMLGGDGTPRSNLASGLGRRGGGRVHDGPRSASRLESERPVH